MLLFTLLFKESITDSPKTAVSSRATRGATGSVYSNAAQTPKVLTMRAMSGETTNMLFTLKQNWLAMDAGAASNTKIKSPPTMFRLRATERAITYSGSESIYVFGTDGWTISDEIPLNSLFIAVNE